MAKSKWPLFLLAWLSLIPVLGFFIGSVAAGWGLVSSRPKALVAAGIGAGGALLNLVALIALSLLSLRDRPELAGARWAATQRSLAEVVMALELYHSRESSYPESLNALAQRLGFRRPINTFDPSAGFFPPRQFEYQRAPDGQSYRLFSAGPDKKPATPDDIYPELPDSLRARSGLRNPTP